jgi:hypothetical protein
MGSPGTYTATSPVVGLPGIGRAMANADHVQRTVICFAAGRFPSCNATHELLRTSQSHFGRFQ